MASEERIPLGDKTQAMSSKSEKSSGTSHSSDQMSSELESSDRTLEEAWASLISERLVRGRYHLKVGLPRARARTRERSKYTKDSLNKLDLETEERLAKEEAKCSTPQVTPVEPHHYGKSHLVEITERLDRQNSSKETNKLLENPEEELQSKIERRLENLPPLKQHAIYLLPSSCSEELYLTPRVVSIGPYHHGKIHLAKMERHKRRFVQDFLLRNPVISFKKYCDELKRIEPQVRKYYFLKLNLTSDRFVKMMVLDGCFILDFWIKFYNGTPDEILDDDSLSRYIKTDLLMFANQIPFMVLMELHELANTGSLPSIYQLVVYYFWDTSNCWPTLRSSAFHNLLHFYHLQFIPPFVNEHLKDKSSKDKYSAKLNEKIVSQVPSAEQLEKAGVIFRGKRTINFLDIKFQDGVLEIPILSLDEPFLLLLVNLAMYEKLNISVGKVVQTYCCFMHCLLKSPHDIELLRINGIIEDNSISAKEFCDQLGLCQNPDYLNNGKHFFADLFVDLWEFCEKKRSIKWSSFFGKACLVLAAANANVKRRHIIALIFAFLFAVLLWFQNNN